MKKKGQIAGVGPIILVFVAVVVGLAILNGGIYGFIGDATTTDSVNTSAGSAAFTYSLSAVQLLEGKVVTDFLAINGSDGTTIHSGNYTITDNVVTNGVIGATINTSGEYVGPWNLSYTTQPLGYISDGGGRSMAQLIAVFAALAILVVALVPVIKNSKLFS